MIYIFGSVNIPLVIIVLDKKVSIIVNKFDTESLTPLFEGTIYPFDWWH